MKRLLGSTLILLNFITACQPKNADQKEEEKSQNEETMQLNYNDPHSLSKPSEAVVTHLDWDAVVDFDQQKIIATAKWEIENKKEVDTIYFDSRNLQIKSITDGKGNKLEYQRHKKNDFLGTQLAIALPQNNNTVSIEYETTQGADALQFLDPQQTADKEMPFLFTQSQAILARTWIPCQDSPGIRFTFEAEVKVPKGMLALMSAENPTETNAEGIYKFKMDQPVPSYLMSLAVGKLEYRKIGEITGVYAEPSVIEAGAYELGEVQNMVDTAEALYGEYRWGKYDVIFLPPSFPFGGMENPRLTFATPTIIAGDRSLTALIAHELSHSWSGNLVTNATWEDIWLNEGFTVYFEHRIMEELYGSDYADMLKVLGYQDLQRTIGELGPESRDTHLYLDLDGRNPDDGMTDVAYEKGSLFLRWLEAKVGRERFDQFLRTYFKTHAFQTMTTEKFVEYLDAHLLNELDERPDVEAWIYGPALPEGHPVPKSTRFEAVQAILDAENVGNTDGPTFDTGDWSTHEWLYFIRGLPDDIGVDRMRNLDAKFGLTESENSEIAAAWFELAIRNDYRPAFDSLREFLIRVGRRKFLKPLYEELASTADHKDWAKEVYEEARPHYHIVSVETVDHILDWEG